MACVVRRYDNEFLFGSQKASFENSWSKSLAIPKDFCERAFERFAL